MMSKAHNLQQHARRFLAHSSRTRFFSSNRKGTLSSIASTQSRIEAALDRKPEISMVLDLWRQSQPGNQLNPLLVRGFVEKLRDSNQFRQSLEVSDWMFEQKLCKLIPEDYSIRFQLIENVFGLEKAEKFFESIPKNRRGESIYTALLNSYTKSGEENQDKAESTFKTMRELGFLMKPAPYNSMTSLYTCLGSNRGKVDEILQEMKEKNVEFDAFTVNNALRVYAAVSDVATMEKFMNDWKTTKLQWPTALDIARAYLGKGYKEKAREMLFRTEELEVPESDEKFMWRKDVYCIWNMYNSTTQPDNETFRAVIASLLKLDDIDRAEKIYNELECKGLEFDHRIPTMLASSYHEKGMLDEANKKLKETMMNIRLVGPISPLLEELWKQGNQVKPSDLRDLIKNLRDSKQFSKALEVLEWMGGKRVCNLFSEDYAAKLHLIENVLGLEEAERFFNSSIPDTMKDYSVYATLLTLYTRSDKTLYKAEATFEKMRELGILSKLSPFSSMISLYSQVGLGRSSFIENLVSEMKEKNIEPDSVTMNNVLRVKADAGDVETMEKYKSEWELKLEVRTKDAMAKAYERVGSLLKAMEITGSKKELYRLWNEYKENKGKMGNEAYLTVISSVLKLDDVKGAEEIYKEWEPEGPDFDYRIPSLLISRYCEEEDHEVKLGEIVESSNNKRSKLEFMMLMSTYLESVGVPLTCLCVTWILIWLADSSEIWACPLISLVLYVLVLLKEDH